ncbi:trans-sulfuration enzyme family protein [Caldanaerobius polysaccharolyticus]|uniref:trans-sulfuration enzyme family protein n=1 Tax=Caldanaerobius polysaccharolyticus TaxID=44256 RepID=UPI00047B2F3B|nr:PLP-dependent aspartate aminotransferase family protein [Caldanaerobius polysaccharolyticus]
MKLSTLLVRSGINKQDATGAISTPIYHSATFMHRGLGLSTGFDYSRTQNPTRLQLEKAITQLEGGVDSLAFSSGMAAITAILTLFNPGDHIIISDDVYGGTYRVFDHVFSKYQLAFDCVDISDTENILKALKPNTAAIFIETPTNPMMKIADVKKIVDICKRHNLICIFDNTFLSVYLFRPLEIGVDIVIESATKYLSGHNDVLAGIVSTAREDLAEKLRFIQNTTGAVLSPTDSWLLLRGLKTLGIRLDRQQYNAMKIAQWLAKRPEITRVLYPGLPQHPGHHILKDLARGFGAMISFEVKDKTMVKTVLENLKIISFAESLGGVESLITYPIEQTHKDVPDELRKKIGLNDRLLRLSVGIEDSEDLIMDLQQALQCKPSHTQEV